MKGFYVLLLLLPVGFFPVNAKEQVGTACLGCMPRTGKVYDSTMTTTSPPFTTSASTTSVYIPPREVTVTVPLPGPPASDPTNPASFQLAGFSCASGGGVGPNAIDNYVAYIYTQGGRCADPERAYWTGGLRQWISARMGTPYAESMSFSEVAMYVGNDTTGTQANILGAVGSPSDRANMNSLCQTTASNLGYISPYSYSFVWNTSSARCSRS